MHERKNEEEQARERGERNGGERKQKRGNEHGNGRKKRERERGGKEYISVMVFG